MRRYGSLLFLLVAACSPGSATDAGTDTGARTDVSAESSLEAGDAVHDNGSETATTDASEPVDAPDVSSCDEDGDGFTAMSCGGNDCDDSNADAHPGAIESCDGIDENCDGNADRLPDGGFDPLADAPCVERYTEGGTVVRATHCYVRGMTTPCGQLPAGLPYDGACYGCWQRSGQPVSCAEWCSGVNICSGSCDPVF